jgi:hypothetical protein
MFYFSLKQDESFFLNCQPFFPDKAIAKARGAAPEDSTIPL